MPDPNPNPNPNPAGGAPGAPATPWFGDLSSQPAEFQAFVTNKGYADPVAALQANWNLERLMGADKAGRAVVLPKDDDADGWNQFYGKLGRPESPDKYNLQLPDGADDSFAKSMLPILHGAGLTQKQLDAIVPKWNEFAAQAAQAQEAAAETARAEGWDALRKEWGAAFDQNLEAGRRAFAKLGLKPELANLLEDKVGHAEVLKLFASIGEIYREDAAPGNGAPGQRARTPAAAQAEIAALKADTGFGQRLLAGDREASALWETLNRQAYPDAA